MSPIVGEDLIVGDFILGEGEEAAEPFAERYIERMEPYNVGPKYAGMTALEIFLRGASAPYETILAVCEESGSQGEAGWIPAWSRILNPLLCPAKYLPYLGLFTGTSIPREATEEEARNLILFQCNLYRGTFLHLNYVLKEALGEGIPFLILERTNPKSGLEAAYCLTIIVPTGHVTKAAYEKLANAVPGGIVWGIIEREGTWFSATLKWSEIKAGLKWSEVTEAELR